MVAWSESWCDRGPQPHHLTVSQEFSCQMFRVSCCLSYRRGDRDQTWFSLDLNILLYISENHRIWPSRLWEIFVIQWQNCQHIYSSYYVLSALRRLTQNNPVYRAAVIIPISADEEVRHREVKELAQGYRARKCRTGTWKPITLSAELKLLNQKARQTGVKILLHYLLL